MNKLIFQSIKYLFKKLSIGIGKVSVKIKVSVSVSVSVEILDWVSVSVSVEIQSIGYRYRYQFNVSIGIGIGIGLKHGIGASLIYNNAFSVFSEHSNKKYGFHPYYWLTLKDTTQFENNHGLSSPSPPSKTLFKIFRPNYAPIVIFISGNGEIYNIFRPKLHLKNMLVKYFQCKISK